MASNCIWIVGSWVGKENGYYSSTANNPAFPKDINFVYTGDKSWAETYAKSWIDSRGVKLPWTIHEAPLAEGPSGYYKIYSNYSVRLSGSGYITRDPSSEHFFMHMLVGTYDKLRKNPTDADYAISDCNSYFGGNANPHRTYTTGNTSPFHDEMIVRTAQKMGDYLRKKKKLATSFFSKSNRSGELFLLVAQNWKNLQTVEFWKKLTGSSENVERVEWICGSRGLDYTVYGEDGEELDDGKITTAKFKEFTEEYTSMVDNNKTNNPAQPTSLTDRLSNAAKDRAQQAALRIGAKQLSRTVRGPLVLALASRMGGDEDANQRAHALLSSDLGGAMMDILLSAMLSGASALPLNGLPREHLDALAVELQVGAMADAGNTVAEIVMGPIRGALETVTMAALPSGQSPALPAGTVAVDFSAAQVVEVKTKKRG